MCVGGSGATAPTRGFVVDTSDRNEVVAFYHATYMASEGYQDRVGWTGNYNSIAAGAEGTVSPEFAGDVERRLNYFRAMCGLPAGVRVNTGATVRLASDDAFQPAANTTKMAAAQRSALMIVRTYPDSGGLAHSPAQSCKAWTPAAWNANRYGNLSLGYFGPGAIDAYAKEDVMGTSNWNVDAGHRRWLMYQGSTDFATGDTPGDFVSGTNTIRPPSNSFYVVPKNGSELDNSAGPSFVSYPAKGFFPAKLNTPFWSLSYPDADFSAATVSMKDGSGNSLSTPVVSRRIGYGDNAIVWQVPTLAAVKAVTADTSFTVKVSNIRGSGVPSEYSWGVTLIDIAKIQQTPTVSGAATPSVSGATYSMTPVPGADEMRAGFYLRKPATWVETAEDGAATRVIDRTGGSYPIHATNAGYVKNGTKAFRLTFPTRYDVFSNGVPEQIFELGRDLLPGPNGKLTFAYRRGLMTGASVLAVETSADSGFTWTPAGSSIAGLGSKGDAAFQDAAIALPSGPVRVRFRYRLTDPASAIYSHQDFPSQATGIFIDDIGATDCTWLERSGQVAGAGLASFNFNSTTAGVTLASGQEWWLRPRAVLGGKAFPWGPAKVVTISGPLLLNGPVQPPLSGADYSFIPDATATGYKLEVANLGPANWLEGAEKSPAPQVTADVSNYSVYSNLKGYFKTGSQSFRLGLSSAADNEDSFAIERQILPAAGSTLDFWVRRGAMSKTNRLHAEVSTDGGATWTSVWNLPGLQKADKALAKKSIPLAAYADRTIRVRFAVRKDAGGTNLKWNAKTSGVWIDDIAVTNAASVLSLKESNVASNAGHVRLDASTAGQSLQNGASMRLRMRPLNGAAPGAWGPALMVSPSSSTPDPIVVSGFGNWAQNEYPALDLSFEGDYDHDGQADGVEYAFSQNPGVPDHAVDALKIEAGRIEISRDLAQQRDSINYNAEWSDDLATWSNEDVVVLIADGKIQASAPLGAKGRYMRWKITQK